MKDTASVACSEAPHAYACRAEVPTAEAEISRQCAHKFPNNVVTSNARMNCCLVVVIIRPGRVPNCCPFVWLALKSR